MLNTTKKVKHVDEVLCKGRILIQRAHMLTKLNHVEVWEGRQIGNKGHELSENQNSYSYWYGWRSGRIDAKLDEVDAKFASYKPIYVSRS